MRLRSSAARLAAVFTATGIAVLLAAGFGFEASAQTPAPKQPAPKQAPVTAQKQKQPAPAPAPAPAAPQAPAAQDPNVTQAVGVPTPWTKICSKDPQVNKEICLITQELRAETGQFLASVAVREVQDDPKKQFIIAVPPGMLLQPGMRLIVDQATPVGAAYAICFPNACYGDAAITAEFVTGMKKGTQLVVQAINQTGRTVNFQLMLKDFAKAYDGPPIDPKVIEEQQKKLQEELQKRADEQRKRLETQQPVAPATPAPPAAR